MGKQCRLLASILVLLPPAVSAQTHVGPPGSSSGARQTATRRMEHPSHQILSPAFPAHELRDLLELLQQPQATGSRAGLLDKSGKLDHESPLVKPLSPALKGLLESVVNNAQLDSRSREIGGFDGSNIRTSPARTDTKPRSAPAPSPTVQQPPSPKEAAPDDSVSSPPPERVAARQVPQVQLPEASSLRGPRKGFTFTIEATAEQIMRLAERFGNVNWEEAGAWSGAVARHASNLFDPILRGGERVIGTVGELRPFRVGLPDMPNVSAPRVDMPSAPSEQLVKLLLAALILGVVTVLAIHIARTWGANAATEATGEPGVQLMPIRADDVRSRADLVRAFETMALIRWGIKSDWWTHRRVADAYLEKDPWKATSAGELAQLYEQARYTPEHDSFPTEHLDRARTALRQLDAL